MSQTLTAPDHFVTVGDETYAYRSFGASEGTPLVFLVSCAARWTTGTTP